MSLIDDYLIETQVTIFALVGLLSLVLDGYKTIPYLVGAILILYINYQLDKERGNDVISEEDRLAWFFSELSQVNPILQYDANSFQQISPHPELLLGKLSEAELGISSFKVPKIRVLPDITAAEVELDKLEERASIILGAIVFLPVIFALIHLFRYVSLGIFLVEIFITISLGILVLRSQQKKYSLERWTQIYEFLESNQSELIVNPRQFMTKHSFAKTRYLTQEIGLSPVIEANLPADRFLYMIIKLLTELDPKYRSSYLTTIIRAIDDLPIKEELIEERWNAYKLRVVLISLSATALGALFASLAVFSVPMLGGQDYNLQSTVYLSWGEYLVLLILNGYVLRQWYNLQQTIRWLVIYSIMYFIFYWLNGLII